MSKLKVLDGAPSEIVMERLFDAPRALVLRAMRESELIQRWSGGKRAIVTAAENDLKVGGRYRTAYRTHDGFEFAFTGAYREVSDERVVHTESMEGTPGESVITTTLTEANGKTTMHLVMVFPDAATRDYVFGTGMAEGADESYDVLQALIATL